MELFQEYTNDDLSSYAQSTIDWQSMFYCLQDYRKKAIEQSKNLSYGSFFEPILH